MDALVASSTQPTSAHEQIIIDNQRLKLCIRQLLDDIDADARRNAIYFGGGRQKSSWSLVREEMKRELEFTNERIAKLRAEIERSHRTSSLRCVEDHMHATKKELALVKGEIQVLLQEAARQRRVLESDHSHQLIKNLEQEIANERAIHSQLRKEAMAIGAMSHKPSKSSTVL